MKVLGITGGIGSGKSEVLRLLGEMDQTVIVEADRLAHQLMMPGRSCHKRIRETFGDEILSEDGSIDRNRLGQLVFNDREALDRLNRIVHPAVKRSIRGRIRRARERGLRLFVIEAALLIQDGYRSICDEIWFVHVDRKVRVERLLTSRGGSVEKWNSVLASQPSDGYFTENSDRVLENSGSITALGQNLSVLVSQMLNS